jgi:hypothetical protein
MISVYPVYFSIVSYYVRVIRVDDWIGGGTLKANFTRPSSSCIIRVCLYESALTKIGPDDGNITDTGNGVYFFKLSHFANENFCVF